MSIRRVNPLSEIYNVRNNSKNPSTKKEQNKNKQKSFAEILEETKKRNTEDSKER